MQNVIIIGREHVPVENIAYVEAFETPADGQFKSDKAYKGRVVLLNRETVLTEAAPSEFAEANGFRLLPEDNVATNPLVTTFRVGSFAPTEDFKPTKPYQTRLMWRGPDGNSYSKLLLTKPETVIAIALRGESEPGSASRPRRPVQPRIPRKRSARRAEV
jgi:hypothetical protein